MQFISAIDFDCSICFKGSFFLRFLCYVILKEQKSDFFLLMLQDPVVRPISELGPVALQELLPEIPLWVKTPDYERVSFVLSFKL
jgi:hypothetical protein